MEDLYRLKSQIKIIKVWKLNWCPTVPSSNFQGPIIISVELKKLGTSDFVWGKFRFEIVYDRQ